MLFSVFRGVSNIIFDQLKPYNIMKSIFTLFALVCFSFGMANAQNKTTVATEKVTKVDSKETLKKAQAQPRKYDAAKIEKRAANVKRIDANNSKGTVITEEQAKIRAKENASKSENNVRKTNEK